jgi:hypothetical protein
MFVYEGEESHVRMIVPLYNPYLLCECHCIVLGYNPETQLPHATEGGASENLTSVER